MNSAFVNSRMEILKKRNMGFVRVTCTQGGGKTLEEEWEEEGEEEGAEEEEWEEEEW